MWRLHICATLISNLLLWRCWAGRRKRGAERLWWTFELCCSCSMYGSPQRPLKKSSLMFTRRFRNVGGNSVCACWTLVTSELFAVNYINIGDRMLSVCFCGFSRQQSTRLNFPEDLLGPWSAGTLRMCWWSLPAFFFSSRLMEACRTCRWAKRKHLILLLHAVKLVKKKTKQNAVRFSIQISSSTWTIAILHMIQLAFPNWAD